mgnify:CR=1 FL=1
MSTPFKLKSGNKPEKSGFFGVKIDLKKLFEHSPTGRLYKKGSRLYKKGKKAYEAYKANKPK